MGSAYYSYEWNDTDANQFLEKLTHLLGNLPNPAKSSDATRNNTTTEVFKFQDKNGQWHFSNEPFGDQIPVDSTTYRSDTNIIAPTKAPTNSSKPGNTTISTPTIKDPIPNSPLSIYTNPASIKKLINDAQQLQGQLNERKDAMDNIVDTH